MNEICSRRGLAAPPSLSAFTPIKYGIPSISRIGKTKSAQIYSTKFERSTYIVSTDMYDDKRRWVRRASGDQAKIILEAADPISCVILDKSEDGFALKVSSVLGIPDAFRLFVPEAEDTFDVRVVWKMPCKIGVAVRHNVYFC